MTEKENFEHDKEGMNHAWLWFTVHSAQRMQGINFFLVGIALVVAGYGAAFQGRNFVVAGAIAAFGGGLALVFWMLDKRTRELVKASELPMREFETRLVKRTGVESLAIVEQVETPADRGNTYSDVIRVLVVIVAVLMVVALAAAIMVATNAGEATSYPTPSPTSTPPCEGWPR